MKFTPFILEHVAKILDWTNDGYEAQIVRDVAGCLSNIGC